LVVRSGSMEPAIKTGSIVIDKNFNEYNIGDIATFKNKDKPKETTTHRIVDKQCQGGVCKFTTKGDANDGPDSEKITQDRIVGKVMFKITYLGYIASFARSLPGLIIIIIIPATIIIYEEMKKIHREAKHIIKKRREKKQAKPEDDLKGKKKSDIKKGEKDEAS